MTDEARLKARLWVQACIRSCQALGITATVLHRGDEEAGAVLIKIALRDRTCQVLTQTRTTEGRRAWMRGSGPAPVPEADADAYIARQRRYDSDLWVVEIESPDGLHPLGDPIL